MLQGLVFEDEPVDLLLGLREGQPDHQVRFKRQFVHFKGAAEHLRGDYLKYLVLGSAEEVRREH